MKKEAIKVLIKDLIILLAMQIIALPLALSDTYGMSLFWWLFITGIPFGWRWASNIITAVSLKGIGIKLLFSAFLGAIAIFVVFIKDIIKVVTAPTDAE